MSAVAVERMMSITRSEFLRLLPLATAGWQSRSAAENSFVLEAEGGAIVLQFMPEPDLTIALLRLPRLRVRLEFSVETARQHDFMQCFDRIYQRGGG
jgi:hypothetical protein